MLLQFNVRNFMSIRDEVTLTAFANNRKDHNENIIKIGKDRILPTIAIYGANASGKTNLFKAMTAAILLVRRSNGLQVNDPTGFEPFLFDKRNDGRTGVDFLFTYNGKKYGYGFVADGKTVYEEYLYEYKSARATTIFERNEVNKYQFTSAYKHLEKYKEKNAQNKLFMCTATAWNCEETRDAYLWFSEAIDTYDRTSIEDNQFLEYLDQNKDDKTTKTFMLSMLKHAEIGIEEYSLETKMIENFQIPLPPGVTVDRSLLGPIKHFDLKATHRIYDENGKSKKYNLPFDHESNGTQLLFAYGPIIMDALQKGRTIIIDELDNSLHTSLCRYLIELFNDQETNRNGAQLIFNSHDVTLLDLDIFRRDQIYFVEKDPDTGVTDLYSLADFSPRKSENVQKGYLQGRFGAIPFVVGGVEW